MNRPRSSRQHYNVFRRDYAARSLDDATAGTPAKPARSTKRREYLKDYLRWLWPERYAVGVIFKLAILTAGLEMRAISTRKASSSSKPPWPSC